MNEKKGEFHPESELSRELTPDVEINRRLERYHKAKIRSQTVSNFILHNRPDLVKVGNEVKSCGSWLLFRHFFTVGKFRLIGGITCDKHLLCLLCAIRRAAGQLAAYMEKVNFIFQERRDLKLCLITLTVVNGDDLSERFLHLVNGVKTLMQRRRYIVNGVRAKHTVLTAVQGAVWTFEVTNKGNGWHPHVHILAMVDKSIDLGIVDQATKKKTDFGAFQNALIEEWKDICGDSKIVDVREVDKEGEGRIGAFCEVFKYALKSNDMKVPDQVEAWECLKGKRLIGSCGLLFGVKVPENKSDSIEEDLALLPYVDMIYRHSDTFGYQVDHVSSAQQTGEHEKS